jgi:hypothetical protein
VNKIFVLHTTFNIALAAMFWLTQVIFKATHTRFGVLSCSNVLVADGTIHTTWRKHNIFNFIWHFHVGLLLPKFQISLFPHSITVLKMFCNM